MLEQAKAFAIDRHGDQRYGEHPYSFHLSQVAAVARRFELGPTVEIAAWLHDVVEDTPTTVDEVRELFDDEVAALVAAVTNEPGANPAERASKTYPKIREVGTAAVALKLSDRIANLEHSVRTAPQLLEMYRREHPKFFGLLHREGELTEMWRHYLALVEGRAELK